MTVETGEDVPEACGWVFGWTILDVEAVDSNAAIRVFFETGASTGSSWSQPSSPLAVLYLLFLVVTGHKSDASVDLTASATGGNFDF